MSDPHETRRSEFAFLWDSYWGGGRYRNPTHTTLSDAQCRWSEAIRTDGGKVTNETQEKRFASYLVPFPAESDRSFQLRWSLATYVNPCGIIVDAYAESCTSDVQRQTGGLAEMLADDVDGRGNAWPEFVEDSARWLATYGEGYTIVDAPASNPAASRAEEIAAGVAPYCVFVHPTAVAWREVDCRGRLTVFAYVDEAYQETNAGQYTRKVTVREWSKDGWKKLEGSLRTGLGFEGLGGQRDAFIEVESGPLAPQLAGQIPVVCGFYKRDSSSKLPRGESLIADAADLARSIYNKRSWEQQIAREAGFPTLVIPRGADGGKLDAGARLAIGPAKALGYDSTSGVPQWIQPSSDWAKDLRESCGVDFQHALRSAGLELATDASAQVQSGEALRIRSRDFESRAKRFARNLQRWETQVLRLFALLAGVSDEITVTYPRRFTLPDLTADLQRALTLLQEVKDVGTVAVTEAKMQAVNAALTLSDEKQSEVRAQIEDALAAAASASAAATDDTVEVNAFDYDAGVLTVNEARALKFKGKLPPIKGGDVPTSAWKLMFAAPPPAPTAPPPIPPHAPQ